MASPISASLDPVQNRYKISISRRRPVQTAVDEQRILPVLPKEIPDKAWADILAREETELIVFDIREEIYDEAMRFAYEAYLERQLSPFTVFCVAQAYLKLIDWAFYRHDPGEDPTNYPPCYIPKRSESWIPDEMPEPSPKDTWAKQKICCDDDTTMYPVKQWPSNTSLDMPVVDPIPEQYWFPGKVNLAKDAAEAASMATKKDGAVRVCIALSPFNAYFDLTAPELAQDVNNDYNRLENLPQDTYTSRLDAQAIDSEVLQKVTDYNSEFEEVTHQSGTPPSMPKPTTPISRQDSTQGMHHKKTRHSMSHFVANVGKSRTKSTLFSSGRSDASNITMISDCQIRNPRLDTTYVLSSQIIEQPEVTAQNIKKNKNL